MSNIVDIYVDHFAHLGREQSTVLQCGEKLSRLMNWFLTKGVCETVDSRGRPILCGLDSWVLDLWFREQSKVCKPSTINTYLAFLNPFLAWAYKIGAVEQDLSGFLHAVRRPKEDNIPEYDRHSKYLTVDQITSLMDHCSGGNCLRDNAIIALILGSGLRVSELCSLTIGAVIGSPEGTVYVKRKGGTWHHVHVAAFAYDYLRRYLASRNDAEDPSRPLFISTHGNPCTRGVVYKAIAARQKALGIPTGPHVLRHTVISGAERTRGAGIARDIANHSSLVVTNRYDHTTPEELREAVNALPWAEALSQKKP